MGTSAQGPGGRNRVLVPGGSGGGFPLPQACEGALTWRQCRAAARRRAQARGRGGSPPHTRRWPAGHALQHRGRVWGEARGGPTLACGDPLPGRGVALMSHLTGGPASHRQERRRPVPVSSEPAPLPAPQRGAHRCTPASSGGSSPEPAAPAPAPQPGTGRCLSPWPRGPGAAACWGCRWPLGAPSHTAPCSCSGRPPGGGAHSWGRERPGSAAPAMLPLGQRQGWGELAMPSHRRVDVAPHAN